MHELSITRSLLAIIEQHAEGRQVTRVRLAVGALTAVEPAALRFCFDSITSGGNVQGARLQIDEIAARARCKACGEEFALSLGGERCGCGSLDFELLCGDELKIVDMEVN